MAAPPASWSSLGRGWRAAAPVLAQPRKVPHRLSRRDSSGTIRARSATRSSRSGSALRELGYVEGQNLEIDFRWAEGQPDRLPGLAAELLRLEPDVHRRDGPGPGVRRQARDDDRPAWSRSSSTTRSRCGLVADFARPGGNITGISSFGIELFAKRLQLLKELVPSARRVARPHESGRPRSARRRSTTALRDARADVSACRS